MRSGGALSSENAGQSNHKAGENPAHRKSKVSWATIIVPGLVGPKPRPEGVGDGYPVNIPELFRRSDGVTQGGRPAYNWM